MKINRIALIFSLVFCCGGFVAAEGSGDPIRAVSGHVSISCNVNAAEGTPVLLLILPEIRDASSNDITASRLPVGADVQATITALKNELDVEYLNVVKVEEGALNHVCQMKDSLTSGTCHVYIKYFGSSAWQKLGEFEHIGQDDIKYLVEIFNGLADKYGAAIEEDVANNNNLSKSSVNVDYYMSLKALAESGGIDYRDDFHSILAGKKPEDGFDFLNLVEKFNETCAWIQLRQNANTLQILKDYSGVYWSIPIESEDFTNLPAAERTQILAALRDGEYSDEESLISGFEEQFVLAIFRNLETREALAALIDENSTYASYFSDVRSVLSGIDDEYEMALIYNYILANNQGCQSFSATELLFKNAKKPRVTTGDRGTSVGGGKPASGGLGVAAVESAVQEQPKRSIPFSDVADDDWAYPYIERLYVEKVINGVSDTEFAPNAAIQRQDFVKIMLGVLGLEPSLQDSIFSDLETGCYYEPYIMAVYENGLLLGVGDGLFGMWQNIRREDAALIISRVMTKYIDVKNGSELSFRDMDQIADYAKGAIAITADYGIFSGDDQGSFNPKASLSRSEACAILCRLADRIREDGK